ncbi:MAG: thiolase domain-containing protein [Promethearchaeota archaeon]
MTSDRVGIIGGYMTTFGEHWELGLRELAAEAIIKSMRTVPKGIDKKEIEALWVGNMSGGRFVGQEHVAAVVADAAGLTPIPSSRVECACASGGLSLRSAYLAVKSRIFDVVIAASVEKMTDQTNAGDVTTTLGTAADQEWEQALGMTFPGVYALMARAHFHKYGTTKEHLAAVAVKNHRNATKNPNAHFRREVTMEQVLNARMVADPLGLFDCSPISDGAAAVVLAHESVVPKYTDEPIWIIGSGQASDTIALHSRCSFTHIYAARKAKEVALKQAKLSVSDLQLAEVHDCFTIAEIMAIEDLGFFPEGEGGPATLEGRTEIDGEIAINPSGGLKGKGHPVGATGIAQAIEITHQLLCEADERQCADAQVGLSHNIGGSGATALVHLFSR